MAVEKEDVKKIIDDQAVAAKAAVDALSDVSVNPDVDALKAQIADLEKKNSDQAAVIADAQASLASEVSKEADIQAQSDAKDAKIAKALADLQG